MGGREDLDWMFDDLLSRRRAFEIENPQIRWSKLVELLRSNQATIDAWGRQIAAFRATLINPELAPIKAASEIQVDACDFDGQLLDSLAEWMAPAKLKPFGFNSFTVLVPPPIRNPPRTPDFSALHAEDEAVVEVKNLRAHECVESAMLRSFYELKRKGADFSGIRLVVKRSFRGTLDANQQTELAAIVAKIRTYPFDVINRVPLSNGAEVTFQVVRGEGDAMGMDHINLDDLQNDADAYTGFLHKIRDKSVLFPATLSEAVLNTFQEIKTAVGGVNAELFVFTDHDYVLASTLR